MANNSLGGITEIVMSQSAQAGTHVTAQATAQVKAVLRAAARAASRDNSVSRG